MKRRVLFVCVILSFCSQIALARIGLGMPGYFYKLAVFEDTTGKCGIESVLSKKFDEIPVSTPNYGLTKSVFWLRIQSSTRDDSSQALLKIHNGVLGSVSCFRVKNNVITDSQFAGVDNDYGQKIFNSQYPVFRLYDFNDTDVYYYIKVASVNVLDLPIMIGSVNNVEREIASDHFYFGIYLGIFLVMMLYNIFIYFTVRDENYLFYVGYIITVGFLQSCLKGYAAYYLWSGNHWLTQQSTNLAIAASGIFSIFFVFNFLNTRKNAPRFNKLLWGLQLLYFVCICVNLAGNIILSQKLLQGVAGLVAIAIMSTGIYVYRKGFKSAKYFNVSWSFFLSGVIIYILKDAGVLPFNTFTSNSILMGSGFEVSLLSFALADKINTYRKEREDMQLQAQAALEENVRIVREQNIILDQRVNERTKELNIANSDLNKALIDLKEAEAQLVESEKMASLGQLTAGIAHEINNPINFVTSNVKPLSRDIKILMEAFGEIENLAVNNLSVTDKLQKIEEIKTDMDFDYLKIEIEQLLSGITDGAVRTADIVKGLRIFSRLDEDTIKRANINEGLESTLIIINNLLNNSIKIVKKYGNLPAIECYPGKLNQVFLNVLSNGIYAIRKKFGENAGGEIGLETYFENDFVFIAISDNGTGMDENTKKRLFEPFFTTKDVGEGTGLGLSIAYNTINKHCGQILVSSELGVGTTFTIKLPLLQN